MSLPEWLREPAAALQRLAVGGQAPHALLIQGPGGWGEPLLASRFALALLALDVEQEAAAIAHPDLRWMEPSAAAATIRVDAIRELTAFMHHTAAQARAKAAVLHRAERMNANAANALLKTLEEPPAGSYLILVSAAPARLPATVRSRCQRVAVRPGGAAAVCAWLAGHGHSGERAAAMLTEVGGAPYRAHEALARGDEPIWPALDGVARGRVPPLAQAQAWRQEDLLSLIERWQRHVHRLARGTAEPGALLRFDAELTALRAVALAASGLNAQVQLERLLLGWRRAAAKS